MNVFFRLWVLISEVFMPHMWVRNSTSKFLIGMANWWEIAVFFIGLGLLILEIFVIPGFGIAGITGVLLILFSLVAMMVSNPPGDLPVPSAPFEKEIFEKQEVVALATATKSGVPNVVPISAKKILDDETILVSDQFFNKTLSNLKENPQATITAWDNIEGYQFKGEVTIETSGPQFEETAKWIEELGKALNLPLKSIFLYFSFM